MNTENREMKEKKNYYWICEISCGLDSAANRVLLTTPWPLPPGAPLVLPCLDDHDRDVDRGEDDDQLFSSSQP